jgi:hypothetical protein
MTPDFFDLVGDEGTPEELEELRQVHELLLAANPPPELARLPGPRRVRSLTRSWGAGLVAFAATSAAAIGLASGYAFGHHGGFHAEGGFQAGAIRSMHGLGAAHTASAVIRVGREDPNGNRPIEVSVRSLPTAPNGGWYELYLTKKGKLEVPCGIFRTGASGQAHVDMNAPADLEEYDGWVVTTAAPAGPTPHVLLTT